VSAPEPPRFTVAVFHRRAGRDEPDPPRIDLDLTGPEIVEVLETARCRSCGAVPGRCPAPDDADVGLDVVHDALCGAVQDALAGREPVKGGGTP